MTRMTGFTPCVMAAALLLAGCASQPPVDPEPKLVRVEVPVLVLCRTAETPVPAWASDGLKASDTLEVKVRALLAERRQRIGYERELVAANDACR
ncbi:MULTISPECIES: hypothetical protein [unclassified Pseudomonas]|uniref:hypothetical protein n=1 Tax=unclassified Pseudomonas TaxID=196821 RepID=UPI00244BA52D|nr:MULTISPECIES: hypothetical protein [unclassified Pseudomonas]MDG9928400.1 hypothetical protein [Pseudomonas sp. GD04042]MDH0482570.1 hypothetical protein [Pseudomonas sp. GD04015]MDH0604728.1 hypothetical protein [Pseudomonas sp. GD03869]